MANKCDITGKEPQTGNNVSHANNKTKRRFLPNLQKRKFWSEGLKRWIALKVSNAALRTIDKNGFDETLATLSAKSLKKINKNQSNNITTEI